MVSAMCPLWAEEPGETPTDLKPLSKHERAVDGRNLAAGQRQTVGNAANVERRTSAEQELHAVFRNIAVQRGDAVAVADLVDLIDQVGERLGCSVKAPGRDRGANTLCHHEAGCGDPVLATQLMNGGLLVRDVASDEVTVVNGRRFRWRDGVQFGNRSEQEEVAGDERITELLGERVGERWGDARLSVGRLAFDPDDLGGMATGDQQLSMVRPGEVEVEVAVVHTDGHGQPDPFRRAEAGEGFLHLKAGSRGPLFVVDGPEQHQNGVAAELQHFPTVALRGTDQGAEAGVDQVGELFGTYSRTNA